MGTDEPGPARTVADLDVVFAPVGTDTGSWLPAIRPGGMLIPFEDDDPALPEEAARRRIRIALVLAGPDGHGLEELVAQVTKGAAGAQFRLPGGDECEFAAHRCDPSPHSQMPRGGAAG
jgi:hypothetical protein